MLAEISVTPDVHWWGKEAERIYEQVFERLVIRRDSATKKRVLGIGDRLGTDVYGAERFGIHSAFVDSPHGADRITDIPTYMAKAILRAESMHIIPFPVPFSEMGWAEQRVVRAQERDRYQPTYVLTSLNDLLESNPF